MVFAEGSEDTRWLAGTNLAAAIAKQKDEWRKLYLAAAGQLKELQWPNAERYTWYVAKTPSCLQRRSLLAILKAAFLVGSP
jgi:hypothetical protein